MGKRWAMDYELISHPLFEGIDHQEMKRLLECLITYTKSYKKNEYIIQEGTLISFIGVLITGSVIMEKEDYLGNNYFYTEIPKDYLFGEVFICPQLLCSTVNYRANSDCTILFIKYDNILHLCSKNCKGHQQLTTNLINLLALKCRSLLEKIEIISKKTIRERILAYLELQTIKEHSKVVISPLNHKELASFLCVNRSAMVRELHLMKEERLIDYDGNKYTLLVSE
jgi:CRP/FNR family transcriptional regulator, dissimilatory nitrate respiration regulator